MDEVEIFLTSSEKEKLIGLYKKVGLAKSQMAPVHTVHSIFIEYRNYFQKLCKKYKLNPHITTFTFDTGKAIRTPTYPEAPSMQRYFFCPNCGRKVRTCEHEKKLIEKILADYANLEDMIAMCGTRCNKHFSLWMYFFQLMLHAKERQK